MLLANSISSLKAANASLEATVKEQRGALMPWLNGVPSTMRWIEYLQVPAEETGGLDKVPGVER
jgi:hypothetical protein